ncbi:amidohydrolase [Streptomyces acidicola]|uniref:amidohydrolase n=1 Tax=Streptomyces acidicola TaxID=2596892 RepID=UPI00382B2751
MKKPDRRADTVLRGGPVLDLSDWLPGDQVTNAWLASRPHAIAIADGEIAAVGEAVDDWIGPATEVIELKGRPVLPGLSDGHLHLTAYSVTNHAYVRMGTDVFTDLADLPSYLTKDAIDGTGWIRGHGWDGAVLGRNLTAKDIDDALAQNGIAGTPVVLFDWSGHSLTANSVALAQAGITAATPDPPGGVIIRDDEGNPQGFLTDAAISLLIKTIPALSHDELVATYLKGQADLHALGITALTEPGLGPGYADLLDGSGSPTAIDVLGDLAESGRLTLRISVLALPNGTGGGNAHDVRTYLDAGLAQTYTRRGIDPRRLRFTGVKVFADGTPQNGTTWQKEPIHEGHHCGHLVLAGDDDLDRVEELRKIVQVVADAGLQIAIHCIGDRTNEVVIDALADLAPHSELRPYLIHGTELYPEGLEKMARYGIGWTANPGIISTFATRLPEHRRRRTEPLGSALRAGVRPGITSDAPVVPPDWRPAVHHVVTRECYWEGEVPDDDRAETITTLDALALLTREAAYRERDEEWRGTLAVGQRADLAVLDGAWPDDEHVDEILDRSVVLTMVDGRIVHRI